MSPMRDMHSVAEALHSWPSRFASAASGEKGPVLSHRHRRLAQPARRQVHRDHRPVHAPPGDKAVNLDQARVNYWLDNGAQPTDTVRSLLRRSRRAQGAPRARLGSKLNAAAVPVGERRARQTKPRPDDDHGPNAPELDRSSGGSAKHTASAASSSSSRSQTSRTRSSRPAVVSLRAPPPAIRRIRDRRVKLSPSTGESRPTRAASSCTSRRSRTQRRRDVARAVICCSRRRAHAARRRRSVRPRAPGMRVELDSGETVGKVIDIVRAAAGTDARRASREGTSRS